MIEWVHVAGYKCLHDVEVAVGPFNVLIGRNDTGKSSFLQALHLLGRWGAGEAPNISGRTERTQLEMRADRKKFGVIRNGHS